MEVFIIDAAQFVMALWRGNGGLIAHQKNIKRNIAMSVFAMQTAVALIAVVF